MHGQKQRTSDFMHALASSSVDAANISADRHGSGRAMVHAYVPPGQIDEAERIAGEHGFELYGRDVLPPDVRSGSGDQAASEGRVRYRFEESDDPLGFSELDEGLSGSGI